MGVVATCILPKSHRGLSPGVLSNNSKALAIEKDEICQPHNYKHLGQGYGLQHLDDLQHPGI